MKMTMWPSFPVKLYEFLEDMIVERIKASNGVEWRQYWSVP